MNRKKLFTHLATLTVTLVCATGVQANGERGAAYTMTNDPNGNQIVVFSREDDGLLTKEDMVSTGGKGTSGGGDPLASQGSLILVDNYNGDHGWRHHGGKNPDSEMLLAVNAGSNDVTVFQVGTNNIKLQDRIGSGGSFPVSLTVSDDMVYILNNGVPANITGFKLDRQGQLHAVPHSTRLLGDGSYGQVAFDNQGKVLIITDKTNNRLLVYQVLTNGLPSATPTITPSSGTVPFGVDFDSEDHLLVVETGVNAVSSYNIAHDGSLRSISASVANGQQASCWIVVNQYGDIITANPGTNSLSSFHIDAKDRAGDPFERNRRRWQHSLRY